MEPRVWLLLGAFVLVSLLLFTVIGVVCYRFIFWLAGSESDRARSLRRRLGLRTTRAAGRPVFVWGDGFKERLESGRALAKQRGYSWIGDEPSVLKKIEHST